LDLERPIPAERQADFAVVLGGIPNARAGRAAELYREHQVRRVIATGTGDCQQNRGTLIEQHVPASAIQVECDSKTTRENALFTIPLLREAHAKDVVLVTSWYHSRRALKCFEHFGPDLHFYSMPSHEHLERIPHRWTDAKYVLSEYLKMAVYLVRWGVWPC
jgi:uncharacterized SAM-binding protein YcdF (DUF218 family)